MQTMKIPGLSLALILVSSLASAATYSELAMRGAQKHLAVPYPANGGGYATVNYASPPAYSYGGASGDYYSRLGSSALPMLPVGSNGYPSQRQVRWSYGQVNASSDPFNTWGLSTQGMYVPWSTPMSAWSNAQVWDWWRNRAGDAGPPPPLW